MSNRTEERVVPSGLAGYLEPIQEALLELVTDVPKTEEKRSPNPDMRSRFLAQKAATRAALVSGTLSLPSGPLGILTILPDLLSVWRIQRQLVTDTAAVFGKEAYLTREQMIYCLFRHAASQAMRDVAIRVGERTIIREGSLQLIRRVLRTVGVRVSEQVAGRVVSRAIPLIGAVGVGGYSYYDTIRVSRTTANLFKREITLLPFSDEVEKENQVPVIEE